MPIAFLLSVLLALGMVPGAYAAQPQAGDVGVAAEPPGDDPGDGLLPGLADDAPSTLVQPQDTPLPPGRYVIRPAVSLTRVLDVSGASKGDGANIIIFQSKMTANQIFDVTVVADGYYTVKNTNSGRVLDVARAVAAPGTNVWQFASIPSTAQKWAIEQDGGAYRLRSALSPSLYLDVFGASDADGANVDVWARNDSAAQKFYFISLDSPAVAPGTVADGLYTIASALDGGLVVDVASESRANGASIQLFARKASAPHQMFRIQKEADGYYSVRPLHSASALDVEGANVVSRTRVLQWSAKPAGSDNQRWAIQDNDDGTVTFLTKTGGLALDVPWARAVAGAALEVYQPNGNRNQRFALAPVGDPPLTEGLYNIVPASLAGSCVDIAGTSASDGGNAIAYAPNGGLNQKFKVAEAAGGTFTLQSLSSGLYLSDDDGNIVQHPGPADAQRWAAQWAFGGVRLVNAVTGRAMALVSVSGGSDIRAAAPSDTLAQGFAFKVTPPLASGTYTIATKGGRLLDVYGGKFNSGANVQIFTANGTGGQAWNVEGIGGKYVTIKNARSQLVLDISGGKTQNNANVLQWVYHQASNQQWEIVSTEENGWFYIKSASGMYLAVAQGGNYDECNICVTTNIQGDAQKFQFSPSSYSGISGNSELDVYLAAIMQQLGSDGDTLKKSFDYASSFRYISGSTYPSGEWSIPFAAEMYRNGGGNCYRYAALFCWLARANGYDARAVSGEVPRSGGGWTAHGWVEVTINGQVYVCDPDGQHELPHYSWYLRTYSNAPFTYKKL